MEPYQGYALAKYTNEQGIKNLARLFGDGRLRVVLPLLVGSHVVYVAAESNSQEDLQKILNQVANDTPGVSKVETFMSLMGTDGLLVAPPTWVPPVQLADSVGFGVLRCLPGQTRNVYTQALSVPGVVALAEVSGTAPTVLAEVTAPTPDSLNAPFTALGALAGVRTIETSVGAKSAGYFGQPYAK